MPHKIIDRCKETTSTTGTGTLTLAGAVTGYVGVTNATTGLATNGDTGWFCAENVAEWEIFLGTRVDATHLARTTILASSNGGAAVSFTSAPTVYCIVPASRILYGPTFSAYRATDQAVTTSTATKVQLATEDYDPDSCFDNTTNYRFQPNVPGYYNISGAIGFGGTSIVTALAMLYKNGTEARKGLQITLSSGNASTINATVTADVYLNGTSDYIELWGYVTATSPKFLAGYSITYLTGHLVRPG